ncbi:MAG: membrane dipeptidase [Candidatus Wallbacteria bacterium]|nr:membrane dipeptidase [Candidatus Wallbacteria bacterium]
MKIPVIDLHADTYAHVVMNEKCDLKKYFHDQCTDFESFRAITNSSMKKGRMILSVQSLFIDDRYCHCALHQGLAVLSRIRSEIDRSKMLFLCTEASNLADAPKDKTGIMIAIEGLEVIENDPDLLSVFHALGVRMVAPTWNRPVAYVGSCLHGYGLTIKGRALLKKMEQLDMIMDISHMSEPGSLEIMEKYRGKVLASHCNARAVKESSRNLSDSQLSALHERGGLCGLNYGQCFLNEKIGPSDEYPTGFHMLYEMIEHIASRYSIDMLAFGSDHDGCTTGPGLENPEFYPDFADFLKEKGVSRLDIEKIYFRNFQGFWQK